MTKRITFCPKIDQNILKYIYFYIFTFIYFHQPAPHEDGGGSGEDEAKPIDIECGN